MTNLCYTLLYYFIVVIAYLLILLVIINNICNNFVSGQLLMYGIFFVMKTYIFFITGIVPSERPQSAGKCQTSKNRHEPWIPFGDHCYKFYLSRESWPSAALKCTQIGQHHFELHNNTTFSSLVSILTVFILQ